MAMTEPRLILSTISQINNQEQDRIRSSYPLSLLASGQTSKNPARLSPCGALSLAGCGRMASVRSFNCAGSFEFACLIPGHFEAGMIGCITFKYRGSP
jgi:hypothetical protein